MEQQHRDAIKKIVQLTKQDEEFGIELRKALEITPSAKSIESNNKGIEEIYEYCIKEVLEKQAENFYEGFPLKELIFQLKADFIRMEDFRRKNDFGYYALATFEQIENICNYICSQEKFLNYLEKHLEDKAYLKNSDVLIKNHIFGKDTNYLELGLKRLKSKSLIARDKYKSVIYFLGKQTDDNFFSKDIDDGVSTIYACRNTIHRGDNATDKQKGVVIETFKTYSESYFRFYATLVEFMNLVRKGYDSLMTKIDRDLTEIDSNIVNTVSNKANNAISDKNNSSSFVAEVTKILNGTLIYKDGKGNTGSADYDNRSIKEGDKVKISRKNQYKKIATLQEA